MRYFVWRATYAGNACQLLGIENVRFSNRLMRGYAYMDTFPKDAVMRMSMHFKRDTKLVDDVMNADDLKVCSPRIVKFLKEKNLENIEYHPITILDHKGKVASKDYCIIHQVGLQEAIDMEASVPTINPIDGTVDSVQKLIYDSARINPKIKIFRLAGLTRPVLIEEALAMELSTLGYVGLSFLNPITVTC
jgi:hypothetical protein